MTLNDSLDIQIYRSPFLTANCIENSSLQSPSLQPLLWKRLAVSGGHCPHTQKTRFVNKMREPYECDSLAKTFIDLMNLSLFNEVIVWTLIWGELSLIWKGRIKIIKDQLKALHCRAMRFVMMIIFETKIIYFILGKRKLKRHLSVLRLWTLHLGSLDWQSQFGNRTNKLRFASLFGAHYGRGPNVNHIM